MIWLLTIEELKVSNAGDDFHELWALYHTDLNADIKREKIVSSISNELSRLSIALLLMRLPPEGELNKADLAAVDALNEEEQKICNTNAGTDRAANQ